MHHHAKEGSSFTSHQKLYNGGQSVQTYRPVLNDKQQAEGSGETVQQLYQTSVQPCRKAVPEEVQRTGVRRCESAVRPRWRPVHRWLRRKPSLDDARYRRSG